MSQRLITTHILDVSIGKPAAGVAVSLSHQKSDGAWEKISQRLTDADGRIRDLVSASVDPGVYRLSFEVLPYFQGRGSECFYPVIEVVFGVGAGKGEGHYHVPLLLSPFGYSTYRGS